MGAKVYVPHLESESTVTVQIFKAFNCQPLISQIVSFLLPFLLPVLLPVLSTASLRYHLTINVLLGLFVLFSINTL